MLKEKIDILCIVLLVSGCGINTRFFRCRMGIPTPSYSVRNFQYYYNNPKNSRAELRVKKEHVFMLSANGKCQ